MPSGIIIFIENLYLYEHRISLEVFSLVLQN